MTHRQSVESVKKNSLKHHSITVIIKSWFAA